MITRRTVLGAGVAFTSVACTAGFGGYSPLVQRHHKARSIDALLIDESIEMPRQMTAFIKASRRMLPVVGIQLDAAALARLLRVLSSSNAIVGISSGATLFCVERIAWDHGLRLTGRSQQCVGDAGVDACRQDLSAFLGGAHPASASPSLLTRVYRPSRADGTLHAWVMQKSARPQLQHGLREV